MDDSLSLQVGFILSLEHDTLEANLEALSNDSDESIRVDTKCEPPSISGAALPGESSKEVEPSLCLSEDPIDENAASSSAARARASELRCSGHIPSTDGQKTGLAQKLLAEIDK
ncbi:hypothetical protein VNI00_003793 [Paramarasmius palmivorus]|uniref:Uncharacterized protein n=1 Tax=Paramarasmius palmivorus TaxID=297713 RepID=A0AAW0DLA9_9AGAR